MGPCVLASGSAVNLALVLPPPPRVTAMPRRPSPELPPCYAIVQPGLEPVAADEIEHDLGGEVKKTARGIVVFRTPHIDSRLLELRTVEDVFVFAWGTDQLTYRAEDLDKIRRWTSRDADWARLLQFHHAIRPKPKGKPTYRFVTQMEGHHGYLRRDAGKAFARGLAGKFPDSWKAAEENAAVEFWLTIDNATAVSGVRLSDRTMRHRIYKLEHRPASLRPTVAAAMVRLAEIKPRHVVLDPMCGAGTLLAEYFAFVGKIRAEKPPALGGDIDAAAVRAAAVNLSKLGEARLVRWDSTRLPLPDQSVDRVLSNPPFGKQLGTPESVGPLYRAAVREWDRLLRPAGRAVLLAADATAIRTAARSVGWQNVRELKVRVLGQPALVSVWRKGD
jgi:tRNA (guanine6-N2)-methyltransferase